MPTTARRNPTSAVLLVLALACSAVLTACGGSSDAGSGGGSAPSSDTGSNSTDGDGGDAGTVAIEHTYGTTEAPVDPERIVSLDTQWTDVLLALDHAPIGYIPDPSAPEGYPWRGDGLDEATPIEAVDQLPYEKIAALDPDLIVVSYFAQEQGDYEKLSAIAPTIATLSDAEVDTWQDITTAAGQVLDDEDAAIDLIEEVDGEVAGVAIELPGLEGKTYSLVNYVAGDQFYVVADPEDGAAVLFDQLGMAIAPKVLDEAGGKPGRVELSLENASLFDADLVLLLANGSDPGDISGWEELSAVQDEAVADLDYVDAVGLNTPTPLSIPYSLEQIRPALEAAAA